MPGMSSNASIRFFDRQFQKQAQSAAAPELNPFEALTLPFLHGSVLDYGCGMGNLSLAAAARGCAVVALDASPTAVEHLARVALARSLPIARVTDLSAYELKESFDAIVCIGLLMFFDCPTARRQLNGIKAHVRAGGVAAVNVLVEGTTYMDMFDAVSHCLFAPDFLVREFSGWQIEHSSLQDFAAPGGTVKRFSTVIALKL
jgi:tellurite methyltransferase